MKPMEKMNNFSLRAVERSLLVSFVVCHCAIVYLGSLTIQHGCRWDGVFMPYYLESFSSAIGLIETDVSAVYSSLYQGNKKLNKKLRD